MLEWKRSSIPPRINSLAVKIRALQVQDMPVLETLDRTAFGPIWHNSRDSLEFAFRQAAIATVAEVDGEIVAYQISTTTQMGGHLARLATRPDFQRLGIGTALLHDLLSEFVRRRAWASRLIPNRTTRPRFRYMKKLVSYERGNPIQCINLMIDK
jgi:ribosomal protein S18 acetylase RimI-like enzyme